MEVKFLLEKYKNFGNSQKRIKEIVREVFSQNSFDLKPEEVDIKDTEIKIKISGTKRTHFILLKSKVEKEIQKNLQEEGLIVTAIF
ncbi:MAG: hypothetical protein RLZZ517_408 [Candidatus Parcubacteria bacterium]|jgi:hypothetical protein